jgi:iron complex transport system ATP-binding protein
MSSVSRETLADVRGEGLALMVQAKDITAGYRDRVVLSSLSMQAEPAQLTILVGPNGSGKSTLLRCLAGGLRPSSGKVTVGTEDLYRLSAKQASRKIAYVAQETAMPFAFTARELVLLAGGGGKRDAADEAIALMDLESLADTALNSLSGGEQQRAAIARGLAQRTPCLLLDEPTAHLDLRYQAVLFQALRRRAHETGCAVIVVLHDLTLAIRNAHKIILLNQGLIEAYGSVGHVITEEVLERVYNVPVRIERRDSRIIAVTPAEDLTFS